MRLLSIAVIGAAMFVIAKSSPPLAVALLAVGLVFVWQKLEEK